ncbi:DinB family protein, partial [Bacillus sp. D-CC]
MFVQSALHQLQVAVDTSIQMLNRYKEDELKIQPIHSKRSLFEMCAHLSLICHADLLILNGSTEKELRTFYLEHTPETIAYMQQIMIASSELVVFLIR